MVGWVRFPGVSFPEDRQPKRSIIVETRLLLDQEGLTIDDRTRLDFATDMLRRGFHDVLDGVLPLNEAIARIKYRMIKAHRRT
jgi:hypothetical protein